MNEIDIEHHTPLSLAIREEKYFSAKILIYSGCDLSRGGGEVGCCLNLCVVKL